MTLVYRLWVGQLDSSVVVAMVFSSLVPWFKTPLGSLEQHCYHIFELSNSCQMIIISILANFNSERYFLPVGYGGSQKVFQKTEHSRCKNFLYFLTFFIAIYFRRGDKTWNYYEVKGCKCRLTYEYICMYLSRGCIWLNWRLVMADQEFHQQR